LIKFVSEIDTHISGSLLMSLSAAKTKKPRVSSFTLPTQTQRQSISLETVKENSPLKLNLGKSKMENNILDQTFEEEWADSSFERIDTKGQKAAVPERVVFGARENLLVQ